jgi:four helix bundle suffix protein
MRDRQLPWDAAEPEAMAVQGLDLDPAPASASGEGGTAGADGSAGATGHAESGGSRSSGRSGSTGAAGISTRYTHRRFCEHLLKQYVKFERWLEHEDSHIRANALVILCTRAAKMQEAYIRRVAADFTREGGFREKMGEARRGERARTEGVAGEDAPHCDLCGAVMRQNRRKQDGSPFWGCTNYPACRGTKPFQA